VLAAKKVSPKSFGKETKSLALQIVAKKANVAFANFCVSPSGYVTTGAYHKVLFKLVCSGFEIISIKISSQGNGH